VGHEPAGHNQARDNILEKREGGGTDTYVCQSAVEGAAHDVKELDEIITKHADNWRLERISAIDRAILRLAMHEMRATDTPPKVVINEAVDLAKKFSSEEAGGFVNGILDTYRKTLNVE